jgi:hypothetical protein
MTSRLSTRLSLLFIAALFFLPLALAWMMYTGAIDFEPASTRNLGDLVKPPVPMDWDDEVEWLSPAETGESPAEVFLEHWVILHVVDSPCDDACMQQITSLRQIHKAAGRNQSRIRLALLMPGNSSADETAAAASDIYSAFRLLRSLPAGLSRTLSELPTAPATANDIGGSSFLVDPLGNIMMSYAAGSDPNNLKKDLKRLLTWSKLDE